MIEHGELRAPASLSVDEKEALFELMTTHYDNVRRQVFFADLVEKDGVFLMEDDAGAIRGFSTYLVREVEAGGQTCRVLFSGDTIVHRDHWGSTVLFKLFIGNLRRLIEENALPLYWILISKGVRTYLMLPLFLKEFYPRAERPKTPSLETRILEAYLVPKYGEAYDGKNNLIVLNGEADRMKSEIDVISERRRRDPAVRFFLERNPGYVRGDELTCIARLDPSNFKPTVLPFYVPA